MLNIDASKARVLSAPIAPLARKQPAIVWRSGLQHASAAGPNHGRLHLVAAPARDRFVQDRQKRRLLRDRVVESAYIAAALGTALVIWWSAR